MRVPNHNSLQVTLGQGLEPVSLPLQGSQSYSIVLITSRLAKLLIFFFCSLFCNLFDVLFIISCLRSSLYLDC